MGKRKHVSRSLDDDERKRSRPSSSSTSSSSCMEPESKERLRRKMAEDAVSESDKQLINYKEKELHKHKKRRKSVEIEGEKERKKKKKKMKKEHEKSKIHRRKKKHHHHHHHSSPECFGPLPSAAGVSETNKSPLAGNVGSGDQRVKAPMTKEQWEKERNKIRRVFDPETGRNRLVRGNGEILEEIVSKKRHVDINKQATLGDGIFYQFKAGLAKTSLAK